MNHLKTRKGRGVRADRERRGMGVLWLALVLAGAGACKPSASTEKWTGPTGADLSELDDGDDEDDDDADCEDGATRYCKVILATHGKVTSCFEGVRICEDGAWGSCTTPPATSTK